MSYLTPDVIKKISAGPTNTILKKEKHEVMPALVRGAVNTQLPEPKEKAKIMKRNTETQMIQTLLMYPEFQYFLDAFVFPHCIPVILNESAELNPKQQYDIIKADVMKELYMKVMKISRRKIINDRQSNPGQ